MTPLEPLRQVAQAEWPDRAVCASIADVRWILVSRERLQENPSPDAP
jgi:hypothetical protein